MSVAASQSLQPSSPTHRASGTFGQRERSNTSDRASTSSRRTDSSPRSAAVPAVSVNGSPLSTRPSRSSSAVNEVDPDESAWGSNFWVTLVNPQTEASFYACPATGQVSWDPPVGNFVLPPNPDGEWWEIADESRGGLPYYYQTKTAETVWEKPDAFVIPLGILQNTALGRRLSQNTFSRYPSTKDKPAYRRSNSYASAQDNMRQSQGPQKLLPSQSQPLAPTPRRSFGNDLRSNAHRSPHLTPITGSDASAPPSPAPSAARMRVKARDSPPRSKSSMSSESLSRARSKSNSYVQHRGPQPQSLNAAVQMLTQHPQGDRSSHEKRTASDSGHGTSISAHGYANGSALGKVPSTPTRPKGREDMKALSDNERVPPSPRRPIPAVPGHFWAVRSASAPTFAGKQISGPVMNQEATLQMSPVKNRQKGKPIPVERARHTRTPTATLSTGTHPILPNDLASDIMQFSESDFARQYFSTHRTGFIFRRRVPVEQMMTWQKAPLSSPLLTVNRSLNRDAVKAFKVVQHIMGDRERERNPGGRGYNTDTPPTNGSTVSLTGSTTGLLDEERWLLSIGLTHGELRDEIYCQVMKQLNGNPNPESVFKGWQMLCVLLITFPPSKNFETYLRAFMHQRTTHQEGRVDVMAKHCLRRLTFIAKKGPRGKPPTIAEIETASDAAFNPSTFGESLDATFRLQERNYPHQKVPIILPFLADGILALGGTKAEGIFRVPGDGDAVSELKLRIDRGYYTLESVDDPHVLASLLKLWLRELCDPLVPEEMYNECITRAQDPSACVQIVERLPTINRRVVLFVISFLQLFLDERVQGITKMTPANLALVMAPNLLRCNSESMAVVFTNAQYEQYFVYHLLLHLNCQSIDPDYVPTHGLGATIPSPPTAPRTSKSRSRRPNY